MARRLVEIDVDADHQVESGERGGDARAVRRGQRGIARDRDQRLDLPLAGLQDFIDITPHTPDPN